MITRDEAQKLYCGDTESSKSQLEKVDRAIRIVAPNECSLTLAISGYSKDFMEGQNKLYPNFPGLLSSTVAALIENGFDVSELNHVSQGHSWTIRW